jgi:hypothetical protein
MNASYEDATRSRSDRGPAIYFGYCGRSGRYRMMDLPDYLSNVQQGMSRWMNDASTAYQDIARGYYGPARGRAGGSGVRARASQSDCGCGGGCDCDCHCECCVCDADVLVHARCGEVRRIPVTFENDTRREREVKLTLETFVTAGGRDLGWPAQLSESSFTLRGCDERTVIVSMQVRCEPVDRPGETQPPGSTPGKTPAGVPVEERPTLAAAANTRLGSVDRCEVGYATIRAEGCLVRPIVVAVAVLPDDCDAYRRPCSCGCCH